MRIKVDERVAHYQCSAVIRMIKSKFAVRALAKAKEQGKDKGKK